MQIATIRAWTQSYQTSPIPLLLMDTDLTLIWVNQAFLQVFAPFTPLSTSLTQFYAESFTEEEKYQLSKSILAKEKGYSWKGVLSKKGPKDREIKSMLLILPVFSTPDSLKSPVAYIAVVDNLNGLYRSIMHNTFLSLLEASKLKDSDTGNHIERVNRYSHVLAQLLCGKPGYEEIDEDFLAEIGFLAALHDVGKIGTPDYILNKNGPLDKREREIMQEHTINGAFILSTYPSYMARQIALSHHEKWDGTGYPYSLSEVMIPLSARIVAIADVYDALRMQRIYKASIPHEETLNMMRKEKGIHFDPELVDGFLSINTEFARIFQQMED